MIRSLLRLEVDDRMDVVGRGAVLKDIPLGSVCEISDFHANDNAINLCLFEFVIQG